MRRHVRSGEGDQGRASSKLFYLVSDERTFISLEELRKRTKGVPSPDRQPASCAHHKTAIIESETFYRIRMSPDGLDFEELLRSALSDHPDQES